MFLVDSNLLVYTHDQQSPFHQRAISFIKNKISQEGFAISPQNIFEATAILTDPKRAQQPLSSSQVNSVFAPYLDHPRIAILNINKSILQQALTLFKEPEKKGQFIFDTVLAATIVQQGLDGIYTANKKDFKQFGQNFKVVNPLEDR